jgi:hypothetical protein
MLTDTVLADRTLREMAQQLVAVRGVVAVTLGGSRARGDHTPESDVDIGVYYTRPLDVAGLGEVARSWAGPDATVTEPGCWGPWVDGGAWLRVDDVAVDWIYRELGRVEDGVEAALAGRIGRHVQLGHPFGVPDYAYAAELALARVLADPGARLERCRRRLQTFPAALSEALVGQLDQAAFLVTVAGKAVARKDTAFVAACLIEAVLVVALAVHGAAGSWVTHEKGSVRSAARLPTAPDELAERVGRLLGGLGDTPSQLSAAVDGVAALVAEARVTTRRGASRRPSTARSSQPPRTPPG